MSFDVKVPASLREIQNWFGSIITRPIDENNRMMPLSPRGEPMEVEACRYIIPSSTLRPDERIQLYNQQYWWRLLRILHENFPLLTRLFGYYEFNMTIGFPYLVKYPSHTWTLNLLGDTLIRWIEEDYQGEDRKLLKDVWALDWAYNTAFFAEKKEPLNLEKTNFEMLLECPLALQPYIYLFEFDQDLPSLRAVMLKESPDYWVENPFPEIEKGRKFYFILSRNIGNNLVMEALDKVEYLILKQIQTGSSIDAICEWLEHQEEEIRMQAEQQLQTWFHNWNARHWIVKASG